MRENGISPVNRSLGEKEYWLNKLAGNWKRTCVPYGYNRLTKSEKKFASVAFKMPQELGQLSLKLSKDSNPRLFMILVAGMVHLLHRYTDSEDILVGIPIYRQEAEGKFINSALVLRNQITPNMTFKDLLLQVRQCIIEAIENQNYPIETLPLDLNLPVSAGEFSLFDITLLLENIHEKRYIEDFSTNINFSFLRAGDTIEGILAYNTWLYDRQVMEQMVRHYIHLLRQGVFDVDILLSQADLFTSEEKHQLVDDFNTTAARYPREKTLHRLFEEQTAKNPGSIAVRGKSSISSRENRETCLTYQDLNEKSNQLAKLLKKKGVTVDTIVGLMVNSTLEMCIGLLGILKAGGAYLPIDPNYPWQRVRSWLEDSKTAVLLTQGIVKNNVESDIDIDVVDLEEEACYRENGSQVNSLAISRNLAYVIYTSGSTGKPKGVLVEHRSIVNYVSWRIRTYQHTAADITLQLVAFSFDGFGTNFYPCLLTGGTLVLIPPDKWKNAGYIRDIIKEKKITNFSVVPSLYRVILEEAEPQNFKSLRFVVLAGEKTHEDLVRFSQKIIPHLRLINEYGPTENTITTTAHLGMNENNTAIVGKPIANNQVLVLDEERQLKPVGIPGELCVSGESLARGYLNQPQLTQEKFTRDSYLKGKPMYRTGDLARWLPEGEIELLGRLDHQEQIRGFRVEPGEIENRLMAHKQIKEAVVIAREIPGTRGTGEQPTYKVLCAYVVSQNQLDNPGIRNYLAEYLPDYMVPTYFIHLKQMPLTPTGKIDRRALSKMDIQTREEIKYVPPRTSIEKRLVDIWARFLDIEKVGIRDNFFNIGGDSIKSISLLNIINKDLQANVELVDLYQNETIEKLAAKLASSGTIVEDTGHEIVLKEMHQLKIKILANMKEPEIIEDIFPMSDIQRGMLFYTVANGSETIYHNQVIMMLKDNDFALDLLEKAMELITWKHPLLRTGFNLYDFKDPVQIVYKRIPLDIVHEDISHLDRLQQQAHIRSVLALDRKRPYDMHALQPLWRIKTFDQGTGNICFVWACHHAIIDGWSDASLMTELNNTYVTLKTHPQYVPEPLKSTYKNFVIEQILEKKNTGLVDFWKSELEGYKRVIFPRILSSPTGEDEEVNANRSYLGDLGLALLEQLDDTAKKNNTSLKHLCFAAYIYMLNMLSFENDVLAGLVTHNRPLCEDGDKIIGCFLNTVPVRMKIPGTLTYKDYIQMVDQKLVQLKKYDKLSLFEIVKITGEASQEQNPLFDTFFNFVDFHVYRGLNQDGRPGESRDNQDNLFIPAPVAETNTSFDFTVDATLGGFRYNIIYSNLAVSGETVKKCGHRFEMILNKLINTPDQLIRKEDLIPDEEKQELLYRFNDTKKEYPGHKGIYQLFEAQAFKTPGNQAVVGLDFEPGTGSETKQLTYRQLNEKVNQLARVLKQKGVGPGTITGIMVSPSLAMITGILAVLKAGGAYLPLDPGYPRERITYILRDSGTTLLLTHPPFNEESFNEEPGSRCEKIDLENAGLYTGNTGNTGNPGSNGRALHHLAYVLYTSGSTGKPKGVMVEQHSVINILHALEEMYPCTPADRYLLKTSFVFDVSVTELFGWYMGNGGLVILPKDAEKDPHKIIDAIAGSKITHINFVPSMFHAFVEQLTPQNIEKLAGLKYIFLAGEALSPQLVNKFRQINKNIHLQVENLYGPTEGTVYSSKYSLSHWDGNGSIPIGRPLQNIRLYILDNRGHLLPKGVLGELCICGYGAARGYLNKPGLTAEKFKRAVNSHSSFVIGSAKSSPKTNDQCPMNNDRSSQYPIPPTPYLPIYLTGDLARWLPDGNIEFFGRLDHQVKIRGFRVELEEIENRLLNHRQVKETVVTVREGTNDNRTLCAYVVLKNKLDASSLREYLSKELPGYMIPSYFYEVEKIPLTISGKLDRKALNTMSAKLDVSVPFTAPKTHKEKTIADIWKQILKLDKVGIHDKFFEIGGTSLDIIKVNNRLKEAFKVEIPVVFLYRYPTIYSLSEYIAQLEGNETVIDIDIDRKYEINKARRKQSHQKARRKEGRIKGDQDA